MSVTVVAAIVGVAVALSVGAPQTAAVVSEAGTIGQADAHRRIWFIEQNLIIPEVAPASAVAAQSGSQSRLVMIEQTLHPVEAFIVIPESLPPDQP